MATLTQAALHDAIASRIPYKPEELKLVSEDFDQWALDCLNWLLPLAPIGAVESILTTDAKTPPFAHSSLIGDPLKIVRVSHATDEDTFTYLEPEEFSRAAVHVPAADYYRANEMSAGGGGRYGKGDRVWTVTAGEVRVFYSASGAVDCDYIAVPAWNGTNLEVPDGWDGTVAAYCALHVAMSMSDLDVADRMRQILGDELKKLGGFTEPKTRPGGE